MENTTNYKPPIYLRYNEQRAKNTIIAFWVLIVLNLIALVSGYYQLELLEVLARGGNYSDAQFESNDTRQSIIGVTQVIMTIILAVLFIMWFRRAYVNSGAIADRKLAYDDVWAVWGFIIPIINLWYPYTFAKEMNDKMDRFLKQNSSSLFPESLGWIIGLWWVFYLIQDIIGRIVFRYGMGDESIEDFITGTQLTILSDLFGVIAALVTIFLIIKMSDKEKQVKIIVAQVNEKNAIQTLQTKTPLTLEEE